MTTRAQVAAWVGELLGTAGHDVRRLSGGDIGEAWWVDTKNGPVFAKTMTEPVPGDRRCGCRQPLL